MPRSGCSALHGVNPIKKKKVMIKCVTHTTKACITLTKSIASFEAGYSSKTIVQQLAVVISVVLAIFAHYLDKES